MLGSRLWIWCSMLTMRQKGQRPPLTQALEEYPAVEQTTSLSHKPYQRWRRPPRLPRLCGPQEPCEFQDLTCELCVSLQLDIISNIKLRHVCGTVSDTIARLRI